jgi:hypothetical protein
VRIKTPAKPRKVPVLKKKVISFINSNINGGGPRNTGKSEIPGAYNKTTGDF